MTKVVVQAVFDSRNPRGVGQYVLELANNACEFADDVQLHLVAGRWMTGYNFPERVSVSRPWIPNNILIRNLWCVLVFPLYARWVLKADVVHIPDVSPTIFKLCPTVSTIHDLAEFSSVKYYSRHRAFVRRILVRIQSLVSDYVVTVSKYSAQELRDRLRVPVEKLESLYFGVSDRVPGLPRERRMHLLCVGPTDRHKNIHLAVGAFLKARPLIPGIKLVIIGDEGNDRDSIAALLTSNKTDPGDVVLTGYISRSEKLELLRSSVALVFLSQFEGLGLPLVEAMAVGTPIVASDKTCIPEIVGDAGIVLDIDNGTDAIADALVRIISDEQLWRTKSQNAFRRSCEFSSKTFGQRMAHIYRKLSS